MKRIGESRKEEETKFELGTVGAEKEQGHG